MISFLVSTVWTFFSFSHFFFVINRRNLLSVNHLKLQMSSPVTHFCATGKRSLPFTESLPRQVRRTVNNISYWTSFIEFIIWLQPFNVIRKLEFFFDFEVSSSSSEEEIRELVYSGMAEFLNSVYHNNNEVDNDNTNNNSNCCGS